jgi:hypothetical protein
MEKKKDAEGAGAEHADERTQRRTAEEQSGGMSSQESAERYASGENPGGTHGGAGKKEAKEGDQGSARPNNHEDVGVKKEQG